MERLELIVKDLQERGYCTQSMKQIKGGINSAVFQIKDSNNHKFLLKIYPLPTNNDPRNRCLAEQSFLRYVTLCNASKIPTFYGSDNYLGWTLMSWVDGVRPINLAQSDINEITDFIEIINCDSCINQRARLQSASEAIKSPLALVESISDRLKKLKSITPSTQICQDAIRWLNNEIEPHLNVIMSNFVNTKSNRSYWAELDLQTIASPSDVGIHNILRTSKGLYFIDFEYAGLDDLSKFAADWILQPEYKMSREKRHVFIECLLEKLYPRVGDSWVYRLIDIEPLIHFKWCLIMLNKLYSGNLRREQLSKTINYHNNWTINI